MSTRVDAISRRQAPPPERKRLDSWKEVAAFFGRDERTVKRWEKSRALPIHRIPGQQRSGIFAYADELTSWLNSASQERTSADGLAPGADINLAEITEPDLFSEAEPEGETTEDLQAEALAQSGASSSFISARTPGSHHWGAFVVACLVLLLTIGAFAVHRFRIALPAHAQSSISIHTPPRQDLRAVEFYLKGRYYWNRRTAESLNRAVDAFTQAIVIDPSYAEAYAGLANTYNLLRQYSAMPESVAYPRALDAANKAVALNDSLSEAHRARAFVLFYWKWQIPEALDEYRKAIQLDPNNADTHHWYATSLLSLGRMNEALAEIERARELNPDSRSILADRAIILYSSGERDAGLNALKEIEQAEPDFLSPPRYLSNVYFDNGDYADYVNEVQRVASLSQNPEDTALASVAKQAWEQGGPHKTLEALAVVQQETFLNNRSSGFGLASTCLRLGRKKDAIHYLQAAFASHDANMFSLRSGPLVDQLKGDQEFDKLRESVLTYLNRKTGQPFPA